MKLYNKLTQIKSICDEILPTFIVTPLTSASNVNTHFAVVTYSLLSSTTNICSSTQSTYGLTIYIVDSEDSDTKLMYEKAELVIVKLKAISPSLVIQTSGTYLNNKEALSLVGTLEI
jgi:hypothetical protein